jgi:hypothetical protein
MGERARAFVMAHHDAERVVDRYLDVYRQALGKRSDVGQP